MSRHAADAKGVLTHYMGLAWQKAGLKWDSDNESEVGSFVDDVIAAAADDAKAEIDRAVIGEMRAQERRKQRFEAAKDALTGLLAGIDVHKRAMAELSAAAQRCAPLAVEVADALLAELAKEPS